MKERHYKNRERVNEKRKEKYYSLKTKRTSFDRNELVKNGTITAVILYKRDGVTLNGETIIDTEDIPKISAHKWHKMSGGYAMSRINGKLIFLHHLIVGREKGLIVDHINRNRLDNRKENLRIATYSENIINGGLRCDNTSGVKGVSWAKHRKTWHVRLVKDKKCMYNGWFIDKEEAIAKRKELEKQFQT